MITFSTILSIDSTTAMCSVAVWKNGNISAYCEELTASFQSKRLILMVEEVLDKNGTQYSELSAVACTVGPGSFTGIRIGLASARGIGFAANVPVLGFSSLEVLAFEAAQRQPNIPIIAVLNAGKGEIIYQHFSPNIEAICVPTLKTATGTEIIKQPRADFLAQLAAQYQEKAVAPLPFYVRPPDAKLPRTNNAT